MINGLKLAKYLDDTGLKVQEFWFLYCVMCCEDNFRGAQYDVKIPQDEENLLFNKYVALYFQNHRPDVSGDYRWSELAFSLEDRGWIDTFQNQEGGKLKIKLCRVTDQFKDTFLVSDGMQAFMEFVAIYPKFVHVNGKKFATCDLAPELMAERYNTHILKKGNALLHERCLLITGMFLRDNNNEAIYKMSSYFDRYEGIAMGYEGVGPKEGTNTGRRAR